MKRFTAVATLALALCAPLGTQGRAQAPGQAKPASAKPAPLPPSPFGMCGLKPRYGKDMPNVWKITQELGNYMVDAGIQWDRAEINWDDVQPAEGQWDWSFTDRMMAEYRPDEKGRRRFHAYVLFNGTAPWLSGPPRTDAERAQYAEFVFKTVSRYKDVVRAWEIWNEPNIPTFWKEPNAAEYAALLKAAYSAAKRADPGCTIIAGSTSTVDLGFLRATLFDNGGWDYADAVSIHPYSMGGGPASQGLAEILRMTKAAVTRDGVTKPLWITEIGWTTDTTLESELRQAEYLVQEYTVAIAECVEKVFWFTLGDWAERWGLLAGRQNIPDFGYTSTYRTKRGFYALKHLTNRLAPGGGRPRFLGYLPAPEGVTAMAFLADGDAKKPVAVLWTDFGRTATFPLGQAAGLHALNAHGKTVQMRDGSIALDHVPVTVVGYKPGALKAASAVKDPTRLVPGENIARNPGMELGSGNDPHFWGEGRFPDQSKDATLGWSQDAHSGARSLSISAAKDGAWHSTPIPVWEGRRYTLRAWVKPAAATGDNRLILMWYTGNLWTWISQEVSGNVTGTGDWQAVTISGVAPKNAVFARITLASKDNTGQVHFDDVTLAEGG